MKKKIANKVVDLIARELCEFKFSERFGELPGEADIVGGVKKTWKPLCRVFGGHGICAVAVVPESVQDKNGLKSFFRNIRETINSRFVGRGAYKSSHSFIVLICGHELFENNPGIASELKDKTGLHTNIIQGVVIVDGDTRDVTGDHSRPAQHKREYDAVLSATTMALK